jgi:histone H3/H4
MSESVASHAETERSRPSTAATSMNDVYDGASESPVTKCDVSEDRIDWRHIIRLLYDMHNGSKSASGSLTAASQSFLEYVVTLLERHHLQDCDSEAQRGGEDLIRITTANLTLISGVLSLGPDAMTIRDKLLSKAPALMGVASSGLLLLTVESIVRWRDARAVVTVLTIYARFYGNDIAPLAHSDTKPSPPDMNISGVWAGHGCWFGDILSAVYGGADEFLCAPSRLAGADTHELKCNDALFQLSVLGAVGEAYQGHDPSLFVEDVFALNHTKTMGLQTSLCLEVDYLCSQEEDVWPTSHAVDYNHFISSVKVMFPENGESFLIEANTDDAAERCVFDARQRIIPLFPRDIFHFGGNFGPILGDSILDILNNDAFEVQLDWHLRRLDAMRGDAVPHLPYAGIGVRVFRQNKNNPARLFSDSAGSGYSNSKAAGTLTSVEGSDSLPSGARTFRALKGSINGITKPALTLLAQRAGCLLIAQACYVELQQITRDYLQKVLCVSSENAANSKRGCLLTADVHQGLMHMPSHRTIAGYGMMG